MKKTLSLILTVIIIFSISLSNPGEVHALNEFSDTWSETIIEFSALYDAIAEFFTEDEQSDNLWLNDIDYQGWQNAAKDLVAKYGVDFNYRNAYFGELIREYVHMSYDNDENHERVLAFYDEYRDELGENFAQILEAKIENYFNADADFTIGDGEPEGPPQPAEEPEEQEEIIPVPDKNPSPDDGPGDGYREEGNYIYISDAQAFIYFVSQTWSGANNYAGKTIYLEKDIVFNSKDRSYMLFDDNLTNDIANGEGYRHSFRGVLDGKNHAVKDLVLLQSDYGGIFFGVNGATIKNIIFQDCFSKAFIPESENFLSGIAVGGVAACAYARDNKTFGGLVNTFSNVKVISTNDSYLRGDKNVGGLIGFVDDYARVNIKNCQVSQDVHVRGENGGGFVGCLKGYVDITDSEYSGNIICSYIWKYSNYEINTNYGRQAMIKSIMGYTIVSQGNRLGGFVGYVDSWADLSISNSCNFGSVGVLDEYYTTENVVHGNNGGFIGECYGTINISDCINEGNVDALGRNAGGIVGLYESTYRSDIVNCTNNGIITAPGCTGGIVGSVKGNLVINNCSVLSGQDLMCKDNYVSSIISDGTIWILLAGLAVIAGGIVVIIRLHKKKNNASV